MSNVKAYVAPRIFDGENWQQNSALIVEDGVVREVVALDGLTASMAE